MIKKPKKCSAMGAFDCQVPMPIHGRVRCIDFCIADIVAALNAANIETLASCCGHGKMDGDIRLEDGRVIKIHLTEKPPMQVETYGEGWEDYIVHVFEDRRDIHVDGSGADREWVASQLNPPKPETKE